MSKRPFWQITKLTLFACCCYIPWFIVLFVFVIFPIMIINSIRRVHIKNKISRKLMKNGMTKKQANLLAQKYKKDVLIRFGSLKGIIKFVKKAKKVEKNKHVIIKENANLDSKKNLITSFE